MQALWVLPGFQRQQHETQEPVNFGVQRKRSLRSESGRSGCLRTSMKWLKMEKTVGEYDIEGNIDMLLNKSRHWEALEVFIKSSDFI